MASRIVDMVALDGSVFWFTPNGTGTRRLFLHADKLHVQKRVRM
ncbi:hypothetical protein [Arthrobacter oryzae]|nr:hypothetical protein [Arthrobacter oryzae]WLQ05850.1 hypothetical protein Q8Z05_17320 [Arthrobacter oryzae]